MSSPHDFNNTFYVSKNGSLNNTKKLNTTI